MKLNILTGVLAAALVVTVQDAAVALHLHRLDGTPVEQIVADSVVSIMFFPSVLDSSTFAQERPELRDDIPPLHLGDNLYVFALEQNTDITQAMQDLRADASVQMVNPVLGDGAGHHIWMDDRLIVKFKDNVPLSQIDSLNRAFSTYVDPPDPEEPMLYFVRVRPDLRLSTLDVAELYYQTGLCKFAQPDFIRQPVLCNANRVIPEESTDPYYADQWHWDNRGQLEGVVDADIDADWAWKITRGSPSLRIAFIDYSFWVEHEDFDDFTTIFTYDLVGSDRDKRPGPPLPRYGSWTPLPERYQQMRAWNGMPWRAYSRPFKWEGCEGPGTLLHILGYQVWGRFGLYS